jgi:hypothetical protein
MVVGAGGGEEWRMVIIKRCVVGSLRKKGIGERERERPYFGVGWAACSALALCANDLTLLSFRITFFTSASESPACDPGVQPLGGKAGRAVRGIWGAAARRCWWADDGSALGTVRWAICTATASALPRLSSIRACRFAASLGNWDSLMPPFASIIPSRFRAYALSSLCDARNSEQASIIRSEPQQGDGGNVFGHGTLLG